MTDFDWALLEVTVGALLLYFTGLKVISAWRLFIRNGDVVKHANNVLNDRAAAKAQRDAEKASIRTYINDWLVCPRQTSVTEALFVDRQRPSTRRRRNR